MRQKTGVYIALVLAAVLIVNLISDKLFFRIDLTADNRYTLNDATKTIVGQLDDDINVTVYFSDDLPAEIERFKRDFKDLLTEYRNLSHGKFSFDFANTNDAEEFEHKAVSSGICPVMINVRDNDQITQRKVYMGAVLTKGGRHEVIPVVQPAMPVEYALSSAIRKMSGGRRPIVGILQGHGEPPLFAMQQALAEMSVVCNVVPVEIRAEVPDSISTLVIVAPTDTITAPEFAAIDRFMERGGRVFASVSRVAPDLNNLFVNELNTGLERWLSDKSISVESKLAIDNFCATANVSQQQGAYRVSAQQQFPYIPFVSNFCSHAITNGLEQVQLPFVSPVVYTGDSSAVFTPLLYTSDKSATLNVPTNIDVQRRWTARDFPLAEIPLGGLLEGKIGNAANSKIIVIGCGDFVSNADSRQQSADNISLLVNSIDYLSDDTGLVALRTKGISTRPIDQLDDGMRRFVKWLNVLLPVLLVILFGIIRSQQQRNLRIKRMEEGYIE